MIEEYHVNVFEGSPTGSLLWLEGEIPNGRNDFGVSYDDKEGSIVPFAPYRFEINQNREDSCDYFIDWIKEGGLEKIDRFVHMRDLTSALKKGDKISLFLKPIQNISVCNEKRVCIPSECILSYAVGY